jgi:hypothetical protein
MKVITDTCTFISRMCSGHVSVITFISRMCSGHVSVITFISRMCSGHMSVITFISRMCSRHVSVVITDTCPEYYIGYLHVFYYVVCIILFLLQCILNLVRNKHDTLIIIRPPQYIIESGIKHHHPYPNPWSLHGIILIKEV